MRRSLAVAVAAATLLTGCSSGSSTSDAPTAQESKASQVAWNPCDGLTAAQVGRAVGEPVTEHTGTADQPRCTFTPVRRGGPAYDISYLFFDGGLDAALDSLGAAGTQLKPVDVAGADAARIAVKARPSGILVTGFVQTGGVVQSVNAAQPAPYDEQQVVASTTALLGILANAAPQRG